MIDHGEHVLISASLDEVGRTATLYGAEIAKLTNKKLLIFSVYPEGDTVSDTNYKNSFEVYISKIGRAHV